MRKFITSIALCFSLVLATTQKSEAVVGAVVSAPAAMSVGGVMILSGALVVATPFVLSGGGGSDQGNMIMFAFLSIVAAPIALIGLVILDGDQEGEIAFTAASSKTHGQFSKDEIATYNKELPKLNAIQQTITAEIVKNPKMDINARWEVLGAKLSPATIDIAGYNGSELMKRLQ